MNEQVGQLLQLVRRFSTTPFLFIGSGITRRYFNMPDWEGLLRIFASRVREDDFAYRSFENQAKERTAATVEETETLLQPIIATLIESSFNQRWFNDPSFRRLDDSLLEHVGQKGVSPFKAEIAQFFKDNVSNPLEKYSEEIYCLQQLSSRNISGIITTNYDTFLESIAPDYQVYVGQEHLVFSPVQGIAEIYKIHGCVTEPEKIVINHKDYVNFQEKSAYLAAKLMTIFVEYPIIFIGYSLSDPNIQTILQAIVSCLSEEKLEQLQDRLIFVDYSTTPGTLEIEPNIINFTNRKSIRVTGVKLYDYSMLYTALLSKKAALPVRVVRFFKEEFYHFSRSNAAPKHIFVGNINDPRIKDDQLAMGLGTFSEFGEIGLTGISIGDWMKNIVTGHLFYDADQLLAKAFPVLNKNYAYNLPVNRYLSEATMDFEVCRNQAHQHSFEAIISKSIKDRRDSVKVPERSVQAIMADESMPLSKRLHLIAHLREHEINITQLESLLLEIFDSEPDIYLLASKEVKTHLNRLIRLYDYLKYHDQWK